MAVPDGAEALRRIIIYKRNLLRFDALVERHRKPVGIGLALSGFAFSAFSDISYKYVSGSYPVMVMGFYGSLVMLMFICGMLTLGGNVRRTLTTKRPGLHALRGLLLSLNFFFFIYGISGLPLAETYTIDNAGPIVASLLAFILLGQRLERHRIFCIIGGFIGVLVVLRPGLIALNIHGLSILASTTTFALVNILTSKIGEQDSPLTFSFYGMVACLAVQGIGNIFYGWVVPVPHDLLILIMAGTFGFIAGVFLNKAFLLIDVALASKFQYTQLLWGVVLGYILFSNIPDFWTITGAVIIIGSASAMVYFEKRKAPVF